MLLLAVVLVGLMLLLEAKLVTCFPFTPHLRASGQVSAYALQGDSGRCSFTSGCIGGVDGGSGAGVFGGGAGGVIAGGAGVRFFIGLGKVPGMADVLVCGV